MGKFTILIHGGAGTIVGNSSDKCHYLDALRRIISEIYNYSCGNSSFVIFLAIRYLINSNTKDNLMKNVGSHLISAVDIVEFAVKLLEDEPLFNAGRGAVFNENGLFTDSYYLALGEHTNLY